MASFRYVVVDVFTDRALQGNQLAVFTDARGLDAETMQALALEIGFSETTFVLPAEADGHARVRIFNPRHELPFAGHPILGTAYVLGAPLQLGVDRARDRGGIVTVELERDESGRIVFGRMEQPLPERRPVAEPEALFAALGVDGSQLPVGVRQRRDPHLRRARVARMRSPRSRPTSTRSRRFEVIGVNCIAGAGSRWKTRMFAPLGAEDAATGSAAGPLAVHVCRHAGCPVGRVDRDLAGRRDRAAVDALRAAPTSREGEVVRVAVGGSAVVVARGEFRL